MKSRGHQEYLLCLFCGMLASSATAISYRDWAFTPASAPISILLEPVSNGYVETTQNVISSERGNYPAGGDLYPAAKNIYTVPSRPSGGYLGQLVIQQQKGARLEFPLTVSLLFPEVNVDDLLPSMPMVQSHPTAKSNLKWHQPMGLLNPDSQVRPERFRRSWSIASLSPADRVALPLILSRATTGRNRSGGSANLYSCLCEIRDAHGTVLFRKQAVELFCPGNGYDSSRTAWVMNEPESDRFLRESAGVQISHTIAQLPALIEPYAEIDALWISDEGARNATLNQALVRRLLLMGIWIYGRDATISNLTAMAGLSGPGPVLLGGIQSVNLPLDRNSEVKFHPSHNNENSLWDNYYIHNPNDGNTNARPIMENRRGLFQPLKGWYLGWTFGVLGIFFVVACIGLPVAFWRLTSPNTDSRSQAGPKCFAAASIAA